MLCKFLKAQNCQTKFIKLRHLNEKLCLFYNLSFNDIILAQMFKNAGFWYFESETKSQRFLQKFTPNLVLNFNFQNSMPHSNL
jgi:hypothetical protein